MLMSGMEKTSINWSTDKVIKTDIFSKIMNRVRYESLIKTLHFSDNDNKVKVYVSYL